MTCKTKLILYKNNTTIISIEKTVKKFLSKDKIKSKNFEILKKFDFKVIKFNPLRRIYIPKNKEATKLFPLSIPTMIDRACQALYLMAFQPIAETLAG
ncbi:hypothetical protein NF27_BP00030 [Candidatus Jidaibacter acanthamoeba]|uniref:Uncharacterized protein n=1 Tax=Candidatus Jidaibacter acanthamoebae TaxID=86105 RepID=A0A0C1N128_9RICK|nr:hypothetical protein NF27_CB00030 [Candidatus Jidaibacter acanthamoeba]KIE06071.1 hypothetical protein NF27_BP00030 [Candidatus Jidaibacter acanthamoeba]